MWGLLTILSFQNSRVCQFRLWNLTKSLLKWRPTHPPDRAACLFQVNTGTWNPTWVRAPSCCGSTEDPHPEPTVLHAVHSGLESFLLDWAVIKHQSFRKLAGLFSASLLSLVPDQRPQTLHPVLYTTSHTHIYVISTSIQNFSTLILKSISMWHLSFYNGLILSILE